MKRVQVIFTLISVIWIGQVVFGQSSGRDERGIPFPSRHYAPPEYRQSAQNWAVVQDERGVVYVANNDGVLEYDGERWRLIPTSTGSFVRSLAVDSVVYVGAKGDFGYLRPDSLGVLRYRSLYEEIPKDDRDFEDIWGTHVVGKNVYYQSNHRLFRWDGERITSWTSNDGFHTSFAVNSTLYVRDYGRGLLKLEDGRLQLVPNGETFDETPIYMMAPHPSGKVLIGTQNKGLLLYDGNSFESLAPHVTRYLQENDLYHGCRLPGNRYALATLGGGVIIMDASGNVVRVLDGSSGLPDNVVNYVFSDREGELWMALNNDGVFRADLNAPLTVHDERTGLEGSVKQISEHEDHIYVRTGSGVFLLHEGKDQSLNEKSSYFKEIDNELPITLDITFAQDDLLAGTVERGVYKVASDGVKPIADWRFTYDLLPLGADSLVYAATRSGLKGLKRVEGKWIPFSVSGITGEIRSLTYGRGNTLWLSTVDGQIVRVLLSEDMQRATNAIQYNTSASLPYGYKWVDRIQGKVTVFSKRGFFRVTNPDDLPENWQFKNNFSLLPPSLRRDTITIKTYREDDWGNLWLGIGSKIYIGRPQGGGSFHWDTVEPLDFPKSNDVPLFVASDSTVWLGDGPKLYRYGVGKQNGVSAPSVEFRPHISQVTTLRRGKVVYGGIASVLGSDSTLAIPYGRDIRVDVAAPLYSTVEGHEYRYKLSGRQGEWSGWTEKPSERYRNLWEGSYDLMVQARNDRGELSQVASLKLNILPPWYRSLWAYLFYGVSFVVISYGYRRYYEVKEENHRARERVRKLEQERIVAERLKRANDRLREANRLKEDFLATTSHELRTPLTNILGSIDILKSMATDVQEQFLDIVEKSGKRLKRTLNALLDLSMLRSGEDEADLTPIAIDECAKEIASDLQGRADEKDLSYWVETPESSVYARVDEQYLDQILRNLIENAIKFTDDGHVGVRVGSANGSAWVAVEDTGIGIDEDFLPNLFDEFKQESRGRGRTYEGNGLGLAISTRLAEQMDGSIEVETTKGEGSTFTVTFPRSDGPDEDDS